MRIVTDVFCIVFLGLLVFCLMTNQVTVEQLLAAAIVALVVFSVREEIRERRGKTEAPREDADNK